MRKHMKDPNIILDKQAAVIDVDATITNLWEDVKNQWTGTIL